MENTYQLVSLMLFLGSFIITFVLVYRVVRLFVRRTLVKLFPDKTVEIEVHNLNGDIERRVYKTDEPKLLIEAVLAETAYRKNLSKAVSNHE